MRKRAEKLIAESGVRTTVLRPRYVVRPGLGWLRMLKPIYGMAERVQLTRDSALRLGPVTQAQLVAALVWGVENPPALRRVLEVPDIRAMSLNSSLSVS